MLPRRRGVSGGGGGGVGRAVGACGPCASSADANASLLSRGSFSFSATAVVDDVSASCASA